MGIRTKFNLLGKKSISRELDISEIDVIQAPSYTNTFDKDCVKLTDSTFGIFNRLDSRAANYDTNGRIYTSNLSSTTSLSNFSGYVNYKNPASIDTTYSIKLNLATYSAPYTFNIIKTTLEPNESSIKYTFETNAQWTNRLWQSKVGDGKLFISVTCSVDVIFDDTAETNEYYFFTSTDNGETWTDNSASYLKYTGIANSTHFITFTTENAAFQVIANNQLLKIDENFTISIETPRLVSLNNTNIKLTNVCRHDNILYALAQIPELYDQYSLYVYSTDGINWYFANDTLFYSAQSLYLYDLDIDDYLGIYCENSLRKIKILDTNNQNIRKLTIKNKIPFARTEPFSKCIDNKLLCYYMNIGTDDYLTHLGLPLLETIWNNPEDVQSDFENSELFKFTINSGTDSSFIIPTSGQSATLNDNNSYNWNIDWGDGTIENYTGQSDGGNGTCTGISHTYPQANTNYQITIKPNTAQLGWLQCFGFYGPGGTNSSSATNKQKMLTLDSPLTKNAIANKTYTVGICMYMFIECSNLNMGPEFNLPFDLMTAAGNCFQGMFIYCSSLTMNDIFTLPKLLIEPGPYFAQEMFGGCTSLTMNEGFNINHITTLNHDGMFAYMFTNCTSLDLNDTFHINLDSSIREYGNNFFNNTFNGCTSLTKINDEIGTIFLNKIGDNAFYMAFANCTNLTGNISIHASGDTIGNNCLYGTFYECPNITSLTVRCDSNNIGNDCLYAFNYNGTNLKTARIYLTLPNAESSTIGNNFARQAFSFCSNLTTSHVDFTGRNNITIGDDFFNQAFIECTSLSVPYFNISYNQQVNLHVGNNFLYGAYIGCTGITRSLNGFNFSRITQVGNNFLAGLFNNCTNINFWDGTSIILPTDLTDAKEGFLYLTFAGCSKLTFGSDSILPQNLTTIGKNFLYRTFLQCSSFTKGVSNFIGNLTFTQEQLDQEGVFELTFNGCTSLAEDLSALPLLQTSPSQTNRCFNNTTTTTTNTVPANWK